MVKLLLSNGADPNARDENGTKLTPLHLAAHEGFEEISTMLVKNGADIEARTKSWRTPLHLAAKHAREGVARMLIQQGADVNAREKDGKTPLHFVVQNWHEGIARLLMENGAYIRALTKDEQPPLHFAVWKGKDNMAKVLIESGADVNVLSDETSQSEFPGLTPLHLAAMTGNQNMVRFLLEHGADPNAYSRPFSRTKGPVTPLHLAALNGHLNTVGVLLEMGAKPNAPAVIRDDKEGWLVTPIWFAMPDFDGHSENLVVRGRIREYSPAIVWKLINKGADITVPYKGKRLLDWAIRLGTPELRRVLHEGGASFTVDKPEPREVTAEVLVETKKGDNQPQQGSVDSE
jgi:ankyrin repeat protein